MSFFYDIDSDSDSDIAAVDEDGDTLEQPAFKQRVYQTRKRRQSPDSVIILDATPDTAGRSARGDCIVEEVRMAPLPVSPGGVEVVSVTNSIPVAVRHNVSNAPGGRHDSAEGSGGALGVLGGAGGQRVAIGSVGATGGERVRSGNHTEFGVSDGRVGGPLSGLRDLRRVKGGDSKAGGAVEVVDCVHVSADESQIAVVCLDDEVCAMGSQKESLNGDQSIINGLDSLVLQITDPVPCVESDGEVDVLVGAADDVLGTTDIEISLPNPDFVASAQVGFVLTDDTSRETRIVRQGTLSDFSTTAQYIASLYKRPVHVILYNGDTEITHRAVTSVKGSIVAEIEILEVVEESIPVVEKVEPIAEELFSFVVQGKGQRRTTVNVPVCAQLYYVAELVAAEWDIAASSLQFELDDPIPMQTTMSMLIENEDFEEGDLLDAIIVK